MDRAISAARQRYKKLFSNIFFIYMFLVYIYGIYLLSELTWCVKDVVAFLLAASVSMRFSPRFELLAVCYVPAHTLVYWVSAHLVPMHTLVDWVLACLF